MIRAKAGSLARVLIVDDNADAAVSLGLLLEFNGYAVDVVTEATACQSHLESFKPDILLPDIAMPRISGYELVSRIRSQPKFEKLPIFALSGYADSEHIQRSLDFGCNQHLIKPVSLDVLDEAITRAVQESHSALGG
jgi:CheY-like chemotaxis protein